MRPLRIATLHSQSDPSFLARCQTPLLWLKNQGAAELKPHMHAWEADVVMLHSQWHPGALAVVRSLQRNGIRVVADFDQDLFSVPLEHPGAHVYREHALQARVRELLGAVDLVIAASPTLAERVSQYNPKVAMLPTGIDLSKWRKPAARAEVRTIGFAGTESHRPNVELLRPVLAKLASKLKQQQIQFVCVGFRPPWLSDIFGTDALAQCSPEDYPTRMTRLGLDIALAPLTPSEFNRSRSALKLWEYAATGAATIASNIEPYSSALDNGVSGILVENHPDAWVNAITKLIKSAELRRGMVEAARRAAEEFDVPKIAPRLLEALESTEPNRDRVFFALPRTQTEVRPNVDIVMPIYNAPELTRQAIEAALPDLDESHRLVLVDDASPDPAVGRVLDDYEGRQWVTIHRSKENRGFVGTCNLGALELARQGADVILMNSDTRPMRGFAHRMAETAGSNPRIGTVTAATNNGTIASVPLVSDAAELARTIEHPLVMVPTAIGHLVYIKREAIDKYGLFDMAFSPGYGEENDFSLRVANEYVHVIDTGCWTWHKGSASFQGSRSKLCEEHAELIRQRYPHYEFEVHSYIASDPLRDYRRRIINESRDPRPRVLHVAHSYEGVGGTEKHIQDLKGALAGEFLSLAAAPHDELKLYCGDIPLGSWPYEKAGWPLSTSDIPEDDRAWEALLHAVKPELIHFHHLLQHPLTLLAKLNGTGIPVVVSIHDYYFLCPDYTLQFCPGIHSCASCFPGRFKGPAEYQALRRDLLGASLQQSTAIVAPSRAAARLVNEVYPDVPINVIPHGIRPIRRLERKASSKVRYGMIGNVTLVKGIEVMLKAWPLVTDPNAELHVYGGASSPKYVEQMRALGIHHHGPYTEGDLPRILSEIDIGVLPSQQPETFCYALSEFFAGGVPVIGSDYGNLGDQIENGVNGWKVARNDERAWAEVIDMVTRDAELRERMHQGIPYPDSIEEMAAKYAALYRQILTEREHAMGAVIAAQGAEATAIQAV